MPRKTAPTKSPPPAAKTAAPRRSPKAARAARAVELPDGGVAADLARRLDELAVDPIAIIASIAADESADIKLRFAAAKELAAYLMAKPRTRTDAAAPPAAVDVGAIIARAWRGRGDGDEA